MVESIIVGCSTTASLHLWNSVASKSRGGTIATECPDISGPVPIQITINTPVSAELITTASILFKNATVMQWQSFN